MGHLDAALQNFCDRHWPCEFVFTDGSRCVNVRSGHASKGHQLRNGRVISAGEYVSEFSFDNDNDDFNNAVYFHLEELLQKLRQGIRQGELQEPLCADIHRDVVLSKFYSFGGGGDATNFHSHTVCLCCLFEVPRHALPCGHILCTSCVKSYGTKSKLFFEIDSCPLEVNADRGFPAQIYVKPRTAGVRVLALDG
jgi:hypothetical protein